MRERVIEQYLFKRMKEIGGMCIKMEPRYNAGIPDRLIIYRGATMFVEVKAPGKVPTDRQLKYHKRLREVGMGTAIVDTKPAVDDFINALVGLQERKNERNNTGRSS